MADIPKRINELTDELANPTEGYKILVDNSNDAASKKMDMQNLLPYREDWIEIGSWDMQVNNKKEITGISNIGEIVKIDGVAIYDDSGNIYDGSALYVKEFYQAATESGQKSNNILGASADSNGSENKIVQIATCDFGSGSVVQIDDYLGMNKITSIQRISNGQFQVNHTYSSAYRVNVMPVNLSDGGTYPSAALFTIMYRTGYFKVYFKTDAGDYVNASFTVQIYAPVSGSSHNHSVNWNQTIYMNSGYKGRVIQVIPKIDVANSKIILMHNFLSSSVDYDSTGNMGSPLAYTNIGQFADFKTAALRGYVVVRRAYKTL